VTAQAGPGPSMEFATWRSLGEFRSFRTHRVFHVDRGPRCAGSGDAARPGGPLLLLHAYPSAGYGWHKLLEPLAEAHRVVVPDLLGSGYSDKPPRGPYDVATLADQVEELLDDLGTGPVHVLAHAYGSTTAQELLARDADRRRGERAGPQRVSSCCFVNGGLFPEATRPTAMQKLLLSPLGPAIARFAPQPYRVFQRKLARTFGPDTRPSEPEMKELWRALRQNDGHRVVPHVLGYLRERVRRRERWVGALLDARVPLCLVNGAADPVSGVEVPRVWRELLPHAPLVQLDAAIGHYPPWEDPGGVLRAYLAFRDAPSGSSGAPLPSRP